MSARYHWLLALGCYGVFLVAAVRWTQSTSGWLVLGLAPVLWLDRQFIQLLPWPRTPRLLPALLIRLGFLAVVGLFLIQIGFGLITLGEAVYLGAVFSLGVFLLEVIVDLAIHLANRRAGEPEPTGLRLRNILIIVLLLVPIALVSPLSVFHPISLRPVQTPAVYGLAHEDVTLRTADGLELAGWLVPHPEPRGSVIFCHGHGGNRQHVFGVLRQLHALGLNVLCFDFRGHGASPGHTASFGLREVPDVLAAEALLVERYPAQPVFLFGVSYGAAVGLQALPELTHVRAAWIQSGFSRLSDVAHNRFSKWPEAVRHGLIYAYSTLILLDSGCWPIDANPVDHLSRCTVPLFFCHGTEDRLIPFPQAQEMYDRYQGPKGCYWERGAGHANIGVSSSSLYGIRLREFFEKAVGRP